MNAAGRDGAAGGAELGMEQRTGEQKVRKETAGWKSGSGRGDRRRNWVDLCIILLTSGVVIAAYLAVMGGMSQSGSSGGSGGGAGEVSGGSLLLQTLL